MCGIFCSIIQRGTTNKFEIFKNNLEKRGPNHSNHLQITTDTSHDIFFYSSVLQTQGIEIIKQPLETERSVLIYNGDIFGGLDPEFDLLKNTSGDTVAMLKLLESCDDIAYELFKIEGPFSLIFYDKLRKKVYFARDKYGRVSLLIGQHRDGLILTSVACNNEEISFIELPSSGLFCFDLITNCLYLTPYYNENCELNMLNMKILIKNSCNIPQTLIKSFNSAPCFDKFNNNFEETFHTFLKKPDWLNRVLNLKNLILKSMERRLKLEPAKCKNCLENRVLNCVHSYVGILFSGGLDCSLLTLLANELLPKVNSIDLINVSFNKNDAPDRLTGRLTLDELKLLCSEREFNYIEIDVNKDELDIKRKELIRDLIYPLTTILDDSLGCALWFAARGSNPVYTSPCRILFVGSGADELFGGYSKHRRAFQKGSWRGLEEALNEDWSNLPYRNLARDNRVICDSGRQVRLPYLDENLVEYVRNLAPWEKLIPEYPAGLGEKFLLRLLAFKMGLKGAASLKKRALQFGSRIANKRENGNDVSQRLLS